MLIYSNVNQSLKYWMFISNFFDVENWVESTEPAPFPWCSPKGATGPVQMEPCGVPRFFGGACWLSFSEDWWKESLSCPWPSGIWLKWDFFAGPLQRSLISPSFSRGVKTFLPGWSFSPINLATLFPSLGSILLTQNALGLIFPQIFCTQPCPASDLSSIYIVFRQSLLQSWFLLALDSLKPYPFQFDTKFYAITWTLMSSKLCKVRGSQVHIPSTLLLLSYLILITTFWGGVYLSPLHR